MAIKDLIIHDSSQSNKGVLFIQHYFDTMEICEQYYSSGNHATELIQRETTVGIKNGTASNYSYYLYTGTTGAFSAGNFIEITALAQGIAGENGKSLVFKWNSDKLGVKLNDPNITEYQYSDSLKGIDGDALEDVQIKGNDMIFYMREFKGNSLKETTIKDFLTMVKSSIILGNYAGMLTQATIPLGKKIFKGTWWRSGENVNFGNNISSPINSIIIANKDSDNATNQDFDIFSEKLDSIISKTLYLLNLGNTSINQVKDIRMQVDDNGELTIKGYDSITNSYSDFATISKESVFGSVTVKDGLYLETTKNDGSVFYSNLIRAGVTPNSIALGSAERDLILVSKNPKIAVSSPSSQDQVIQFNPIFKDEKSLASYSLYLKATASRDVKSITIKSTDNIGDYYISCTNVLTGKKDYESRNEYLYNNGLYKDYKLSGDVVFQSTSPFLLREGETYKIDVKLANNANIKGLNKKFIADYNPNIINYNLFTNAQIGHYWRISVDGNITIGGQSYPVKAGNSLICLEDVVGTPTSFDNNFSLEATNYQVGQAKDEFVPYLILNTDIFTFDEIAGKSYVDSIVKGGTDGELYIQGNATTNDSVLITTKQNTNNYIEFNKMTDATNKNYTSAIIKDISLPNYPSLIDELKRLKAGRIYKGTFDPNTDTLNKFENARTGYYWQVSKDGITTGGVDNIKTISGSNPLITDVINGNTVTRNIKQTTLKGTENWIQGSINTTNIISFGLEVTDMNNFNPNNRIVEIQDFTNYPDQYPNIAWSTEGCATNLGYLYIMIEKSKLTTLDVQGFKTWLQNNNKTFKYQLKTSYTEPYTGSGGSPLLSIDNTNIKDTTDGTTITRNIGTLLLNGAIGQNWTVGTISNTDVMSFDLYIGTMFVGTKYQIISQIVESGYPTVTKDSLNSVTTKTECCATEGTLFTLVVKRSKLPSADIGGFKTWLQGNNLNLKYQLKTPTTEPDVGGSETTTLKTGQNIVCITDIVGIPHDLDAFVIEPSPTFAEWTPNTSTQNGIGGIVPSSKAGDDKWLNSKNSWSSLPLFIGTQNGIVERNNAITGNSFLCDDGFWKEINVSVYQGATPLQNAITGTVPIATIAEIGNFLRADGSWQPVLSATVSNYFTEENTFGKRLIVGSNNNMPFMLSGNSGVPINLSDTELIGYGGFVIHNSTVGAKNTTSFVATGQATSGISSDFKWYVSTGATPTTIPTQIMSLETNGCLKLGNPPANLLTTNSSIVADKRIQTTGDIIGGRLIAVEQGVNIEGRISASQLTGTGKTFFLPNDASGTTFATREWVQANVSSGSGFSGYVYQTTSTAITSTNANKFYTTTMIQLATTGLSLSQVYNKVGDTVQQRYIQFMNLCKEMATLVTADDASREWIGYLGNLSSSAYLDTSTLKTGLSTGSSTTNPSLVNSTSASTVPSGGLRFIIGRDSTNIYYVNVGIFWSVGTQYSISYETGIGTFSDLNVGLTPYIRTTTAFTSGSGTNGNSLLSGNSFVAVQLVPVRNETWA